MVNFYLAWLIASVAVNTLQWLVFIAVTVFLLVSALFPQVENAYADFVVAPKVKIRRLQREQQLLSNEVRQKPRIPISHSEPNIAHTPLTHHPAPQGPAPQAEGSQQMSNAV